jgi:hypothetical protein
LNNTINRGYFNDTQLFATKISLFSFVIRVANVDIINKIHKYSGDFFRANASNSTSYLDLKNFVPEHNPKIKPEKYSLGCVSQ